MFGHAVKTCALKSWGGIGKVAVTASWRPPLHCRLRKRGLGGDGQQLDIGSGSGREEGSQNRYVRVE